VDTSGKRRRSWTVEVKRRIAEESFEGNASVAQLSQKYAVNANQIFQWRKNYREGRLEKQHLDQSASGDRLEGSGSKSGKPW
jgi:transposase